MQLNTAAYFKQTAIEKYFAGDYAIPRIFITLLLWTLLSGGLAFATEDLSSHEASRGQQLSTNRVPSINEAQSGQLLIKTPATGALYASLLLSSDAQLDITGLMAHVSVKQTFKNTSDEFVEAIYVFPLPETAAVNRLVMYIGPRRIEGKIKEKTQAEHIYNRARKAGKKASLMSQQRPNMFTTSVANISPGETITVELEYVQQVEYQNSTFSLRFPMTITPRYLPGHPLKGREETYNISSNISWGQPTSLVKDADEITPFLSLPGDSHPTISLKGSIDMGMAVGNILSATHPIAISRESNQYHFSFRESQSMQQDFEISWRALVGSEPKVALFTEALNGEHYALLMMLPPDQLTDEKGNSSSISNKMPDKILSREMIYIIDTSGSMGGVSIAQAKASLDLALSRLNPGDKFNVVAFNSTTSPLHSEAVPASSKNIRQARAHVASLQADGGTEMFDALSFALNPRQSASGRGHPGSIERKTTNRQLRQIIFITDGSVGNEEALFKLIHTDLGESRLFTVGIGSAPNSYFMRKAAEFGRGTHTHIGSVNEVQAKMDLLFQKLESPVARDIEIHWPDGYKVETYPDRVSDLFRGEPLFLSAKVLARSGKPLTEDIEGAISINGVTAAEPWSRTLRVRHTPAGGGVATLWARRKISALEDEQVMGADPEMVKQAITTVALTHKLVSKYTSFVAVENAVSRQKESALRKHGIPNAAPLGQSIQTFAYPRTATNAGDHLYYGGLLLIFALMISLMSPDVVRRLRYGEAADTFDLLEK